MRSTSLILTVATCIATTLADCNDAVAGPETGEIRFYTGNDCTGSSYNVGAWYSCQDWIGGYFGSVITRPTIVCNIYARDNCEGYIATIDSDGWRTLNKEVQAVSCSNA